MPNKLKTIAFRFTYIFVIGFIVALPFPFYILPDIGKLLSPVFESINGFWENLLINDESALLRVISDSTGLYLHLITLTVLGGVGALIWTIASRSLSDKIQKWFHTGVVYYLALILFKYGFDKVFKHQFYLPEPNTLYTPLGQLSPDILFWSSMGSSYEYSMFSGLIELLPAILLLFKRTRLLGGLTALAVLTNVVMINFGFDISVKVYSLFLLMLSFIIIAPNAKQLFSFFLTQKEVKKQSDEVQFKTQKQLLSYALIKSFVIGIILFESLGGYFEVSNFNDDNYPRPYLHGAYTVDQKSINEGESIKRVFFHRKQYFIIQYTDDSFESYDLKFSEDLKNILITDDTKRTYILAFQFDETKKELTLTGKLRNKYLFIITHQENLKDLPFFNNEMNWMFD